MCPPAPPHSSRRSTCRSGEIAAQLGVSLALDPSLGLAHALAIDPMSAVAHGNLGLVLLLAINPLERRYRDRDPMMTTIAASPWYDRLHDDPRFRAILADMRLENAASSRWAVRRVAMRTEQAPPGACPVR